MSHYHMEIVLPPGADYEERIQQAMASFDENADPDQGGAHGFWDWYVIGGRWSGVKAEARAPDGALDRFREALHERGITVSGVQCGKPTLSPASQATEVDRLWREMVPGLGDSCTLFDNYKMSESDVCDVRDVPEGLSCHSFAVAAPDFRGEATEFATLLHSSIWNGCIHQDTTFRGGVRQAIEDHNKKLDRCAKDYADRLTVTDDWLCVTVDYHT